MNAVSLSIAVAAAYLCGSTPFGLLIGKAHGVDLRAMGSGNIGATNCGRVLGRKWGIICFVLDLVKGFAPVFLSGWWFGLIHQVAEATPASTWGWLGVAVAAVLGHVFPVWLGFRGGKGVATGLGAVLGIWPWVTLPAFGAAATWIVFAGMFRYVGLASVVASIFLPGFVMVGMMSMGQPPARALPYLAITGAMAMLIVWRHRSNLARAWAGTESRLGERITRETPK